MNLLFKSGSEVSHCSQILFSARIEFSVDGREYA